MSEHRLDDLCEILDSKRVPLSAMQRAKRQGPYPYYGNQSIIDYVDDYLLDGKYLLVAEDGANLVTRTQDIANIVSGKIWVNNHAHILGYNGKCPLELLGFILNHSNISPYVTGCAQPKLNQDNLRRIPINLPEKVDAVSSILSSLDDKIAVNRRICENLEAQAQALFKHWFIDFAPFKNGKFVESELGMIPEGWRVSTLTEIAEYLNGLAMQKYPPISDNDAIPVLKIRELGQSQCDNNSDKCSKQIKPEYIIKNGDVVFSWSGTLMVDIWCGGICGLNQHLFKVTSDTYPKWFYLMWTKYHLAEFIRIAKDKAVTMGHIRRGDLEKAFVAIPDSNTLDKMSEVVEDILNQIINTRLESNTLSSLRDTLLPKLMSGQIKL